MLLRVTLCDKHLNSEAGIFGPELGMMWEKGTFVAVFTITHVLCQLPRDPARSADTIQTALQQLAIHICPHLNSADDLVWDALKTSVGRHNGEVVASCTQCGAAYGMVREAMGMGVALNMQRRVHGLEDPNSQEVRVHLEDCSPKVRVEEDAQREEQDVRKRTRGGVKWVLGLMIGLVVLALILNRVRNVPVRRRVTPRRRGGTQANDSRETIPLLGEAVDKCKKD